MRIYRDSLVALLPLMHLQGLCMVDTQLLEGSTSTLLHGTPTTSGRVPCCIPFSQCVCLLAADL